METIFETVKNITRQHNEKIIADLTLSDVTEEIDAILSDQDCIICTNTRCKLEKMQLKLVKTILNRKAA